MAWDPTESTINLGDDFSAPTLSATVEGVESAEALAAVTYTSDNESLLNYVDGEWIFTSNVTGKATITASIPSDNETYSSNAAKYTLTVVDPNEIKTELTTDFFGNIGTYAAASKTDEYGFGYSTVYYYTSGSMQYNTSNSNGKGSGITVTAVNNKYIIKSIDIEMTTPSSSTNGLNVYSCATAFPELKTTTALTIPSEATKLNSSVIRSSTSVDINAKAFAIRPQTTGVVVVQKVTVHYEKVAGKQDLEAFGWSTESVTLTQGEEFTAPVFSYAPADANINVNFSSNNNEVATVSADGVITLGEAIGTATITATFDGDDTYNGVEPATTTITVNEKVSTLKDPELSFAEAEVTVREDDAEFVAQTVTNPYDLPVTYSSSDTDVADYDNGELVILGAGQTTITATFAGNDEYKEGSASYTLTVTSKPVLGKITVNGEAVTDDYTFTCVEGTPIVFAAENAEMIMVEVLDNGNVKVFEVNEESATTTWDAPAVGTYTASVDVLGCNQEDSAVFTITVTEKPLTSNVYAKVTSEDQLVNGAQYVLISVPFKSGQVQYGTYVMGAKKAATGFDAISLNAQETTIAAEYTLTDENISYITLENSESGEWYMNIDGKYLDGSNVKAMTLSDDPKAVSITVGENATVIKTGVDSSKDITIQFYGQNSSGKPANEKFDCYSSTQHGVFLFKQMPARLDAPTITIDGNVITDFDEAIDLQKGEKVVTITAADESHHIYHKHSATGSAESVAPLAETEDGYTWVQSHTVDIPVSLNGTLSFYAQHPVSGAKSDVKTLTFVGDSTAIFEVEAGVSGEAEWFDLTGRRVAKPAKGGVYIIKEGSKTSKRTF